MMKTHLIMPMGGAGSRFANSGYMLPKPLIEIEGKPFFFWATRSIEKFIDLQGITYIVLQEHVDKFNIDKLIKKVYPAAEIKIIPEVTPGPVFTCLEGVKHINDDSPIIFNDCDHMFKCMALNNMLNYQSEKIDGALLTFESQKHHFSYIRYGVNGDITGTVEKEVVSTHAICGAYYFRSANLFRDIAEEYIESCPYKETFLSGMYNVMCQHQMYIKDYLVDFHVEFGTPEEYEKAKASKYFHELQV